MSDNLKYYAEEIRSARNRVKELDRDGEKAYKHYEELGHEQREEEHRIEELTEKLVDTVDPDGKETPPAQPAGPWPTGGVSP